YGFAQERPRIGVLRFTNHTRAGWWTGSVGQELQDMLAAELAATKSFQVLERREIDAVLGEQDLGASGRIDTRTRAKIGAIKGAKYLVAATVTSYEEDVSGTGGGFGAFGVRIGGETRKAYIAIDLKVINTTTSEIVDARSVEASSSSSAVGLSGYHHGFSGSLSSQNKTPTGKAIRGCIIEAAEYLQCSLTMPRDDSCWQEYAAKDSRRKERTKGSIDLE
ncbi:MAG: CsgG/HfaB family protein, partial [Syntrophobacterales bacterium]|nr:CsgG/HfaB family protein [Syntrophobacterales bacterium]